MYKMRGNYVSKYCVYELGDRERLYQVYASLKDRMKTAAELCY